jgi:hypothetical protein
MAGSHYFKKRKDTGLVFVETDAGLWFFYIQTHRVTMVTEIKQ